MVRRLSARGEQRRTGTRRGREDRAPRREPDRTWRATWDRGRACSAARAGRDRTAPGRGRGPGRRTRPSGRAPAAAGGGSGCFRGGEHDTLRSGLLLFLPALSLVTGRSVWVQRTIGRIALTPGRNWPTWLRGRYSCLPDVRRRGRRGCAARHSSCFRLAVGHGRAWASGELALAGASRYISAEFPTNRRPIGAQQ